jgi:hypothetical protein
LGYKQKVYNTNELVLFVMFSGTAHCADMYPSSSSDPPQLVAARRKVSDLIGQWLDED